MSGRRRLLQTGETQIQKSIQPVSEFPSRMKPTVARLETGGGNPAGPLRTARRRRTGASAGGRLRAWAACLGACWLVGALAPTAPAAGSEAPAVREVAGFEDHQAGEPAQLARRADQVFGVGLKQLETEPATAGRDLAVAAGMYELLADHPAIRASAALRNAGNAWLLAGDPGRALLNFRRALSLEPGDRVARAGLREARERRGTVVGSRLAPGSMAFVRDQLAVEQRGRLLGCLLGANALLWLAAAAALRWRSIPARRLAWLGGGLTLAALVLWVWSAGADPGVVTARDVVGRHGNGQAYAAAWQSPLGSGVEFSLVEDRGDWWKIRLADGSEGWIPAASAERVRRSNATSDP